MHVAIYETWLLEFLCHHDKLLQHSQHLFAEIWIPKVCALKKKKHALLSAVEKPEQHVLFCKQRQISQRCKGKSPVVAQPKTPQTC